MNYSKSSEWQRIEQIIKYVGLSSVHVFARHIGLKRSENLYQMKKGNNGISKKLASMISAKYPEVSKAWLLTGEGSMLTDKLYLDSILSKVVEIPFYDIFPTQRPPVPPLKTLYFSRELTFSGELAVVYQDDALSPLYKRGAVLFLKEWDSAKGIIYGEVYFIETSDFGVFRIIRKAEQQNKLILKTLQPDKYDDMIIDKSEVRSLYLVTGVIMN